MEQKNTIVKCARHNCLWNHCGTCDQYVIPIGVDGQCGAFVETAPRQEEITAEDLAEAQERYQCAIEMFAKQGVTIIPPSSEPIRGQRAKFDFFEDAEIDPEIVKEVCKPFTIDDMMDVNDKHLGEPVTVKIPDPKDMDIHFTIQNSQMNIKDLVPECDLPVCDWSCKHAFRTGPTFNPELWCEKMQGKPARGLFCSEYEEEIDEV